MAERCTSCPLRKLLGCELVDPTPADTEALQAVQAGLDQNIEACPGYNKLVYWGGRYALLMSKLHFGSPTLVDPWEEVCRNPFKETEAYRSGIQQLAIDS